MSKKKVAVENYQISNNFLTTSIGRRKAIEKLSAHEGLQTFYTPFGLADSMVNGHTDGTIRVFFNLEFLEVLLNRKKDMSKVQYVGDTERKCRFAKILYKVETVLIDKENWDIILKGKKQIGEFFVGCKMNQAADVTFSNPPYSNKDLQIILVLAKSNLLKKLICVHPCTWLIEMKTRLGFGGLKLFKNFRECIRNHLERVMFFDPNPVFSTGITTDCVISETDFTKKIKKIKVKFSKDLSFIEIDDIDDITFHERNWVYLRDLKDKLVKYIEKNGNFEHKRISTQEAKEKYSDKFFVQFAAMTKNSGAYGKENKIKDEKSTFYIFWQLKINKDGNGLKCSTKSYDKGEIVYIFDTEKEKNNFLEITKTDFMRFCLSILKINSHLNSGELSLVPWLNFTQEWDDDKLFSFFGYAKGHPIREYAKTFLPDYHNLYPNGKSY